MARMLSLVWVTMLATTCATPPPPASPFPSGELVDLTHPFDERTVYWPTSDAFRLDTVAEGLTPAGYYYAANNLFTAEHGGTHIDAPIHFAEGRPSVDQIPLTRFFGHAVLVDVSSRAESDADYQVTVEDLVNWESEHGQIPPGTIMLIRTGFARYWPDAARYLGTDERGEEAVAQLHFPGLHPDAARWLVDNRPVRAVGIDTASIDFGQSTAFESHQVLFASEIPAFENLMALDRLPPTGAFVVALPMKIAGGSGGPLRAVAVLPPDD